MKNKFSKTVAVVTEALKIIGAALLITTIWVAVYMAPSNGHAAVPQAGVNYPATNLN